jgi:uncharacterized protein (TIGR03000 family)
MFRKSFSFAGLLVLAGAAVLMTASSGQAQHHGGGGHGGGGHGGGGGGHGGGFHGSSFHGGGGHGGGFHGSGFHGSGFHGSGFHGSGFHHSDFHHGDFHHGIHHGDFRHGDFRHGDFRHGDFHHGGFWWNPRYGYWGASPYYYGSYPYGGYSDDYPYIYSSDGSSPAYDSGYYGAYGDVTSSYLDTYSPTASQPDTSALVTVSAPADAEIWFNDTKTTSTGSVREYQSPPLTPGTRYTYELRARWSQNGHEVTQTQQVEVTAGTHVNVQFPERLQPTKAPTVPRK